jgi:dihydroorotate dehydrogenase electron transfer subunit
VAPVQVSGPVLTVRRVDAYHALTVVAPAIAAQFRPGQFLTVAVGGPASAMLARRAFSIHDVHPDHGGTVEFIVEAGGPGTRWLAGRRSRDLLDLAGPLGRPFPLPRDPVSCLLLGTGHHSAALFPLADRLRERGGQVDFMLGARSADRVFGALRARRTARSTVVTTEDGSLGSRGVITGMLAQVVHEARTDVIYAAAPLPVLREVAALASRYQLPVQALVEQPTACGTGVCMSCVLPVTGPDGVTRIVRACTEGPVFRADLVRWDDVGAIPFDALGAPGWKPPRPVPSPDPGARPARGPGAPRAGHGG